MKIARKEVHVTYNQKTKKWQAKKPHAERASATAETKEDMIKKATEVAKNDEAELIIHNKDGKISNSNSYGNDPCPPRDEK